MKSLAIITTHPIQYNAPWFKLLAERKKLSIKVFYTWGQLEKANKYDPGFGKNVAWDIPMLEGYDYTFVENISMDAGSHHYKGIDNPGLVQAIESWDPDAILVFGWNFKSHLKVMRYFHGRIPVLFRGDSTLLNKEPFFKGILKRISLNFVYRHVDKALYVGELNKAYFKNYGLKESQLTFAPHAIDNDRFMSAGLPRQEWADDKKKELGIPRDATVILYAGKLEPVKNLSILIRAFNGLARKTTHIIIAGNGPLENELKKMADGHNNIHFMPFQNQSVMPSVYRLADLFVLPSTSETWGLAINEAMACGGAVLVSDKCGCYPDLVHEGINGFVFKSDDWQNLLKKMEEMLFDKDKLSAMGIASGNIIDNWSYTKICEAVEAVIK